MTLLFLRQEVAGRWKLLALGLIVTSAALQYLFDQFTHHLVFVQLFVCFWLVIYFKYS